MGFTKHGHGEVLPEEGENHKTASQNWTNDDQRALDDENTQADKE